MEFLPVLVFPSLLIIAAAYDMTTMTIPNWISGMMVICFIGLGLGVGFPLTQIGLGLGVGFGCLLLGMVFFALGWLGGGDAKLIAATAVWFGWPTAFPFLVYVMLIGGAETLLLLSFRRSPLPAQIQSVPWIGRLHGADGDLPYGVAIAVGGIFALSQSPLMSHIAG